MHLTPLSSIIANTWRTPFTVTFLFSILVVEESCRSTSLEADAADKADKEAGLWWNMMDTSLGTCHCCCRWCRCWYVCMSFSLPWFGLGECGCWMSLLFWCVIVVESCIFRKGMMCMNHCRCSSSSLYRLFDPRLQSVGAISYVSYEYSPAVLKTSWDLTLCTCVYTRNID